MSNLLLHGFNNVGWPVDKRNVFLTLRSREACTMLRQVSPITTNPSLSCCAYGAFGGPKIWCRTWWASIRSRPISRRIWQLSSRGWICLVISKRCEWCRVTSGVGISSLLLGMWSHSSRVGSSKSTSPSIDLTTKPFPLLPKVTTLPEHVDMV